jgi:hypothetical protein
MTQTINGDYIGVIDTEDGPMVFGFGPTVLFLEGDNGWQKYHAHDHDHDGTHQGIIKCIWEIIQNKPFAQGETSNWV